MDAYEIKAQSILDRLKHLTIKDQEAYKLKQQKQQEQRQLFLTQLANSQKIKQSQTDALAKRISEVKENIQLFIAESINSNNQIQQMIQKIQLNTRQEIERNRKEQQLIEKHQRLLFQSKIQQMMLLERQISNAKNQQSARYQQIVDIELPYLLKQIKQQKEQRRQIQQNIIDKLVAQLMEIKLVVQQQIRFQRQDEQQLVDVIKNVNNSLQGQIRKEKQKQKKTEGELRGILSHVLLRMKNEVLNEK